MESNTGKLRNTAQRSIILNVLKGMKTHPTADELYEKVRNEMPRISLGTVYRNLMMLAELGVVRKLETAGKQMRFDGDLSPHVHIRCRRCGRVDDIWADPISIPEHTKTIDFRGYQVTGYALEYEGICPDCAQKGMN
ncbi:MAG: transcriptional repressor [Dissulfuribacterales bacterium]